MGEILRNVIIVCVFWRNGRREQGKKMGDEGLSGTRRKCTKLNGFIRL